MGNVYSAPHHVGDLLYSLIMAERFALALEKLAEGGQLDQCVDALEKIAAGADKERTSTLAPGGQSKEFSGCHSQARLLIKIFVKINISCRV